MANPSYGSIGPSVAGDGTVQQIRMGRQGDQIVSELHGRFYEQAYRGNLYMGGMTTTSIANATFTTATTGATATPIVGVWNPANSGRNLVILQAAVSITLTAGTATGIGTLVWTVSAGNTAAPSTGTTPFNMLTLAQSGSVAKSMAGAAITGATVALAVLGGSSMVGGSNINASFVETAVGARPSNGGITVENFDGALIVPPGAILALQCTTTPVAHSAASRLVWEEVPV